MNRTCLFLLLGVFLLPAAGVAQKAVVLSSPDKNIVFRFRLPAEAPLYAVSYRNRQLIGDSELGLSFRENGVFQGGLKMLKPVFREGMEAYTLVVGKTGRVEERFKEVLIPLRQAQAPFRQVNIRVRAFNDGVAFRYEFPQQEAWQSYALLDELTSFRPAADPGMLVLELPHYTTSHEGRYSAVRFSDVKEDVLMDMPALLEFPGPVFMAITEAMLVDYAGMYLVKRGGVLTSALSPLPQSPDSVRVRAVLPHRTPWRVMMISDRPGALIESNILTSLNEPLKIGDVSWIRPGKTTWPWWNGNVVPDTTFAPGNNFATQQYHIDFCAANGIEYHSVVEYGQHEWYVSDGVSFQPGPHTDVTRPVPGLDMQEVCDYAAGKGVGIRVWVHWAALYPKLDTALALFEKWGVKGMMVDFMDRDDQEMVNIQQEIVEKAAAHRLHVQFHGAYKPTGLSRTYPNEFTREGTLNYEVNKWGRITPDDDLNIPFTRMLAGPTDYHLGGFRAVPDAAYRVQYTRPLMAGTRGHMLGMYVVLESYLGMLCDYPDAYKGQPGFDFLKVVPTTWDETRVLNAAVGGYVTIARRKGRDWYVGSVTNSVPRTLEIPLRFLPEGTWQAVIWQDGRDVLRDPNDLLIERRSVNRNTVLPLSLAAGGGAVIQLKAPGN